LRQLIFELGDLGSQPECNRFFHAMAIVSPIQILNRIALIIQRNMEGSWAASLK